MLNSWIKLGAILGVSSYAVEAIRITSDATEVANQTFAYVVVGGGTAGLTVASRLAEDPETTILVIEAGPNAQNDTMVNDPGEAVVVPNLYNWGYNTTLQSVGGQVLAMTQYMKKAEFYHLPNSNQTSLGATVDPSAHGYNGLVNAGYPQPYEAAVLAGSMVSAALAAIPDLVHNVDVASGTPNGAARFQYSIKPGNNSVVTADGNTRSSSANAYIYPSLEDKPNLVILVGHQATRLVWGTPVGSLSTAIGVKFIATPQTNATIQTELEVGISKEAIVASGGIGSPHFLELSGIGDAQNLRILENAGIAVERLSLHLKLTHRTSRPSILHSRQPVAYLDIEQVLGMDGARMAGDELLQTISSQANDIVSAGAFTSVSGMEKILLTQVDSILNHSVNPRFFSGPDFDLFLKGNATRLLRQIFDAQPLEPYNAGELSPGLSQIPENATDSQWQDFVISSYTAVYHPIGSVAMLPREAGGAVGPDLIVYGTSNVRVVGK
ncbi:hypothetical protein H0H92_002981 [Tricholoma furcatifolium]|nr:hypothetical protein H0H92_002981 [Tricholoma furcatifolium]